MKMKAMFSTEFIQNEKMNHPWIVFYLMYLDMNWIIFDREIQTPYTCGFFFFHLSVCKIWERDN